MIKFTIKKNKKEPYNLNILETKSIITIKIVL
jgi:hypothetical protein